jgi:pyruvate kinase
MNYGIIATLGPASEVESIWYAMLKVGATGFRLNTSHLSLPQLQTWLERLEAFLAPRDDPTPPLVLDLQGSKWRLGHFSPFTLALGEDISLICSFSTEHLHVLPVPHSDFFRAAAKSNGEIVLDDGRIFLRLESIDADSLRAKVIKGGKIVPRKGITFTASTYRQESLDEKDRLILAQTGHLDFIHYAVSYVKDAAEMARYRSHMGLSAYVIAKLERGTAVQDALQIAQWADELWLCRGDLGAELGLKPMAETVHRCTDLLHGLPRPVLLAGQVLDHLTEHPHPTRSEICYLYDVLVSGYRGVVLSDETAIGRYPVESCRIAALFRSHL